MSRIKTCVSLYSLQDEYMRHKMSLEDIFGFVSENNIQGIEILPDQMLHKAPHPDESTLEQWDSLINKYHLTPVCDDIFLNTNLYLNRELTKKECADLIIQEIKLANRLGFRLIRLVSMVPYYIIEPVLPYAEKYDVTLALEVHAGLGLDVPKTQEFIKEMIRVNSPYIGLVMDAGLFCRKLPRVMSEYCIHFGLNPKLVEYMDNIFENNSDFRHVCLANNNTWPDEVKSLVKTDIDKFYVNFADGYENLSYSIMDEYMPYIKHFHFKLYEMTDEGEEYSIDYKSLIQYLHDHNYDHYVSTEYEGNRWVLPGHPIEEKKHVLSHQKMISKYIKEIEG